MIVNILNIFAASGPTDPSCIKNFLGLKPWYNYLPSTDFGQYNNSSSPVTLSDGTNVQPGQPIPGTQCDIVHFKLLGSSSDVTLVLLAVVDDLLVIAGLVALGFVIAGAVGFITSEGNSDKAAQARTTIINALVGLAVAVTATVLVSFLGNKLGN